MSIGREEHTKAQAVGNFWTNAHSVCLLLFLIAIPACTLWACSYGDARIAWLVSFIFTMLIMLLIGDGTSGVWLGILIDDRKVMSLSRFQLIVWTMIVLSAFSAAAIWNISVGYVEPLRIAIPGELWLLMGISTTSLVASPLILSNKKELNPLEKEMDQTFRDLHRKGSAKESLDNDGMIVKNKDIKSARWSDMLTGEETGNAASADISRIQMFFFTLIVAFAYIVALWAMFGVLGGEQGVEAFPSLDESVIALIGISHAGYITAKATPHSRAENDNPPKHDGPQ
jgi:hypothetical protein